MLPYRQVCDISTLIILLHGMAHTYMLAQLACRLEPAQAFSASMGAACTPAIPND